MIKNTYNFMTLKVIYFSVCGIILLYIKTKSLFHFRMCQVYKLCRLNFQFKYINNLNV